MKESPILFSGPLVRAILDGRKTVTRRPVKPSPHDRPLYLKDGWLFRLRDGELLPSPFGERGDRLWVRETWRPHMYAWNTQIDYAAGGTMDVAGPDAEYATAWIRRHGGFLDFPGAAKAINTQRWRPSIHMPRWASRIMLDVVSVRVERLHEITEEDTYREGTAGMLPEDTADSARDEFSMLWDSIYGTRSGLGWSANPWVWRVEFRVVRDA